MSQVEDVAPTRVGRTVAVQRADNLFTHLFRRGEQCHGVEVALQHAGGAHTLARRGQVHGPVDTNGIGAAGGQGLQPGGATLGEQDGGHAFQHRLALLVALLAVRGELGQDAAHVGQREALVRSVGQDAAPGIEDHDRLSAGFDLGIQVVRDGPCIDFQHPVQ